MQMVNLWVVKVQHGAYSGRYWEAIQGRGEWRRADKDEHSNWKSEQEAYLRQCVTRIWILESTGCAALKLPTAGGFETGR